MSWINNTRKWGGFLAISGLVLIMTATLALGQSSTPAAPPADDKLSTTWIILRHAERNGKLDELTAQGQQRAEQVRQLGELLRVNAIYTTNFQRTRNTVAPLATSLQLEPVEYADITESWLASLQEKHRGQTVLIVGHSNTAGIIAGKLAKQEGRNLREDEYNALFLVTTHPDTPARSIELRFGN